MKQCRSDAIGEQRRGEIVEHRPQHHLRLVGPTTLKHRHSAEALQDLIEAAFFAERPIVSIAGQPAINETRIDRPEPRIVDAEPGRHRWPKILDQDIGGLDHPM